MGSAARAFFIKVTPVVEKVFVAIVVPLALPPVAVVFTRVPDTSRPEYSERDIFRQSPLEPPVNVTVMLPVPVIGTEYVTR